MHTTTSLVDHLPESLKGRNLAHWELKHRSAHHRAFRWCMFVTACGVVRCSVAHLLTADFPLFSVHRNPHFRIFTDSQTPHRGVSVTACGIVRCPAAHLQTADCHPQAAALLHYAAHLLHRGRLQERALQYEQRAHCHFGDDLAEGREQALVPDERLHN